LLEFLNIYLFHWMPEKAIWIAGHTLSWDARCSGIYIGFGIGILYHLLFGKKAKNLPPLAILLTISLFFIPLFLDVVTVKYGIRQPSNDLRFLTGLLFGQALSVYLYPAFITLAVATRCERSAINSWYKFVDLIVITSGALGIKYLQHLAAYYILEILAVFGCLSLFTIIVWGVYKIFDSRRLSNKTGVPI
jgi:uncharacterized membrane protein